MLPITVRTRIAMHTVAAMQTWVGLHTHELAGVSLGHPGVSNSRFKSCICALGRWQYVCKVLRSNEQTYNSAVDDAYSVGLMGKSAVKTLQAWIELQLSMSTVAGDRCIHRGTLDVELRDATPAAVAQGQLLRQYTIET